MRKRRASPPSEGVSKRISMDKEFRVSGKEFQAWFNLIPDLVVIVNEKGKTLAVNDAVEKVGSFNKEELVGKNLFEENILTAKSKAITMKNLGNGMMGAQTAPYEIELVTKGGEKRWGEVTATKIEYKGRPANLVVFRDITEGKKMGREIQAFSQFLSGALNNSPDLMFIKDRDLRYVVVSDAACNFIGRPREEILGRTAQDLYPKDFADSVERTDREALEKGAVVDVPGLAGVHAEEPRIYHTRKAPLRDTSGNITHVVSIARDITERERMEDALKQSETKLKALHKHARTLTAANTIEEVARHTLDVMEFTLGFDVADFCTVEKGYIHVCGSRGMQMSPSKWPLDGPGVVVSSVKTKRALRIADTREEPSFVDRRAFSATEKLQPMLSELAVPVLTEDEAVAVLNVESSRLNAFTGEDQELLETLAMHVASALGRLKQVDTLERAVEERARELKVSEEKYRSLVDNMTDVVFTIDLEGNFTFCSQSAEKMTGYSVQQLLSMNMKELIAPEHFREIQERLQARIRGEKYLPPHQFDIVTADGKRLPLEMTTAPIVERGTLTGIQGIGRDISDRKQLEEMKDRFISAVTHEVRTPPVSIIGYLDLVLEHSEIPQEVESNLQVMKRNADRLLSLTNDLLDIRRMESGKFELNVTPLDLKEVIKRCVEEIQPFVNQKKQNLNLNIPVGALPIQGDATRLSQVLTNLLSNAVKFTPEGGRITVSVKEKEELIEVELSDTGIGIRKEDLGKVFEPFANIQKPSYVKGTGLGLNIVKRLVEAHGGKISARSPGEWKGTTFTFTLPTRAK